MVEGVLRFGCAALKMSISHSRGDVHSHHTGIYTERSTLEVQGKAMGLRY